MKTRILDPEVHVDGLGLEVSVGLENRSQASWDEASGFLVGWQLFDPETSLFISEGEWAGLSKTVEPGGRAALSLSIALPQEPGRYHIYVSPRTQHEGWYYELNRPFLLVEAEVRDGRAAVAASSVTTLGTMRRRGMGRRIVAALTRPWKSLGRHRLLIQSLTRRDIAARYRGSAGDLLWTVLNPLLLMMTYAFVFGVVLRSRFPGDPSRSGFVLYFLAGMLPWLPFAEAVGRAPGVILEYRNWVKKLLFPVEVLPATPAFAALVSEGFALLRFLVLLLAARGGVPATSLWLPMLAVPQLMLTLGVCWLLAALGVFLRDLGQMIGLLLTLVFFTTPICYPEESLPAWAVPFLDKSPIYMLVSGYRAVLLGASHPEAASLAALWLVSAAVFVLGYACFARFQKTFPDVI